MRKIIKAIIPKRFLTMIKKMRKKMVLNKAYKIDKKRFNDSAFNLVKEKNQENLESKITFHYHSIEKGLSNINFREGFGERAYTQLLQTLTEYKNKNLDVHSTAYQTGLSVLNEYLKKHNDTDVNTTFIEFNLKKIHPTGEYKDLGGVFVFQREDIINASKGNFEDLATNRFSVRDYSTEYIHVDKIKKAFQLASKTPSVCNRQPWYSYIVRNKNLIKDILSTQGGFTGHGNNIDTLILVAANNNCFSDYTERNQGYTDCGMYAMSLIYALQYQGLATCALNSNLTLEKDQKIRSILNVPESQNLVMFISVGNYEVKFKVPKSPRDSLDKKTSFIT